MRNTFYLGIIVSAWAMFSVIVFVHGAAPDLPLRPKTFNVPFKLPSSGATYRVKQGDDLQAVINNASLGDVIILDAGATFTGNFTLPNKTSGSGWIYIISSDLASLPEGKRVGPADAAHMPKITTTTTSAIETLAGAHNYRFAGIEVSSTGGSTYSYIHLFKGGYWATSDAALPSHIWFDRCYFHAVGDGATNQVESAFLLDGKNMAVFDSCIANIKCTYDDGGYGIKVWNGPGPYKIVNNFIEVSGINFLSGGSIVVLANNSPANIEFRGNYVTKKLSWKDESWWVKNCFEIKDAHNVLIEGNIFENCSKDWAGQSATAIVFTVRGSGGDNSSIRDVTFRNNIIRECGTGFRIYPWEPDSTSLQMQRVLIENNCFYNISKTYYDGSKLFMFTTSTGSPPALDVIVRHNTMLFNIVDGGKTLGWLEQNVAGDPITENLVFENNILGGNQIYSFGANGGPNGWTAWNTYGINPTVVKNVVIAGYAPDYPTTSPYYSANPANMAAVGFTDYANYNYRLTDNSPYKNWGSDGKNPGPDWDTIKKSTLGVLNGRWDTMK